MTDAILQTILKTQTKEEMAIALADLSDHLYEVHKGIYEEGLVEDVINTVPELKKHIKKLYNRELFQKELTRRVNERSNISTV